MTITPKFEMHQVVTAKESFTEEDFNGCDCWSHALPGEIGEVVYLQENPEIVTVRWFASGTVTDCDVEQLAQADT